MERPEEAGEENGEGTPSGGGGGPPARRKKRRRKRIRSDSHLREEGSSSSDEREKEKEKEKEREHAEPESPAKEQYVGSLQVRSVALRWKKMSLTGGYGFGSMYLLYKDKYANVMHLTEVMPVHSNAFKTSVTAGV